MKNHKFKSQKLCLLLLAFSFLLTTSMKCKKDSISISSENQLPPITQEGKNTFGFLLNGEVWVPKAPLLRSKLDLSYDPGYKGGSLNIVAYKYEGDHIQQISIGNSNINQKGKYNLFVYFHDDKTTCSYEVNSLIPVGEIIITNFDLNKKIISGTFSFKLEKDGCPTINGTQGRFDMPIG